MKHTASTLLRCLLLATVAGCGVSNAFINGSPVGGQSGLEGIQTVAGSGIGSGTTTLLPSQPPVSALSSAGIAGGSVMPPPISASAGTPAALPNAPAGAPSSAVAPTGPEGGASGSAALPSSSAGCRQAKFSLALRLTIDMRWEGTIALMAGAGKYYIWSKLIIDPGASTVSEFRSCGSLSPILRGTALAGNSMAFQQVPLTTYDLPTMPFVAGGSATRVESALMLQPAPLLVGIQLPDPAGAWPASASDPTVMPVDADGDGKRGVTSRMRTDAMFTSAPTSILQTEHLDATYVASRLAFRAKLNDAACSDTLQGTAELLALDQLLLGCHVQNRDDCRPEEFSFIDENRPKFTFGAAAVVQAVVIPLDASCAQVVKLLEVPGP